MKQGVYDAAYLELALRENIPLITLEAQLIQAAKNFKVHVNPNPFLSQ